MENGNFRGFPKKEVSEDTLRSTLALYIQQETFCEPRSSSGNNDITVPSEKVIIETKLWNGIEYYNSGFPELNDYMDKSNYTEGYYIVFDYNKTPNVVMKERVCENERCSSFSNIQGRKKSFKDSKTKIASRPVKAYSLFLIPVQNQLTGYKLCHYGFDQ